MVASSEHSVDLLPLMPLSKFARYIGIFGLGVAGLYSGIDGPMAMIGASLAILVVLRIRRMPVFRRCKRLDHSWSPARRFDART